MKFIKNAIPLDFLVDWYDICTHLVQLDGSGLVKIGNFKLILEVMWNGKCSFHKDDNISNNN